MSPRWGLRGLTKLVYFAVSWHSTSLSSTINVHGMVSTLSEATTFFKITGEIRLFMSVQKQVPESHLVFPQWIPQQDAICLKCHFNCFLEIGSGFFKRFALREHRAILRQIRCILLGHKLVNFISETSSIKD